MRNSRGDEQGAVSIEYVAIGVALTVILSVLAVSGVGPSISQNVAYVFCKAASAVDGRGCAKPVSVNADGQTPKEQAEAGDYVALGDSYSSGEGAGDYVDNTNSDDATKQMINDLPIDLWPGDPHNNICRRSANAYSEVVYHNGDFKGDFIFGACSGGVMADYYNDNGGGNEDEGPQRDHLTEDTSLVTISMGGNDFGFGNVVAGCVIKGSTMVAGSCGSGESDSVKAKIDIEAVRLVQFYKDLAADTPDKARILIVGYPQLFPDDPSGLPLAITNGDQKWINDMGAYANQKIQEAIIASGTRVEFVDVTNALNGHEIGTDEPWIHDLTAGIDGGNWIKPVSNNSFHPTAEGQNAIGAIVQQKIKDGS